MDGEGEPLFASFGGDCEEYFARETVVNLDEIDPTQLQLSDGLPSLSGIGDRQAVFESWFGAVHVWAGPHNLRSHTLSCRDLAPPSVNPIKVSAHVAHASNAIHDQQRKSPFGRIGQMTVHVPESRDQEFPAPVDQVSASRN